MGEMGESSRSGSTVCRERVVVSVAIVNDEGANSKLTLGRETRAQDCYLESGGCNCRDLL